MKVLIIQVLTRLLKSMKSDNSDTFKKDNNDKADTYKKGLRG